jgi:hypothetical protein
MGLFLGGRLISPITISENNFDELIDGSITSIEIPSSINSIKNYAFYDCNNLTTVNIPSTINYIAPHAFSNCPNLTTINIDKYEGTIENEPWDAYDADINWKPIENGRIDLTDYVFDLNEDYVVIKGYTGSNTQLVIPKLEVNE